MKVMYAIDSLHGGGAETSLIEMAAPLAQRGVQLSIVTLVADDSALSERAASLGLRPRRMGGRTWLGMTLALRRELRRAKPDVLHTSLLSSDLCGRVAALGVGVPVVTSLVNSSYGPEHRRGSRYGAWAVRGVQALDALTSRRTDVFHAISNDVAAVMRRRLCLPAERIVVVYRGRDGERLGRRSPARRARVRAALGISETAPLVLAVGRLDRQKGIDVALRAFARLRATLPDAEMIVAGRDGNASDEVHRIAREVPGVRLLGHRPDAADLMSAADCLLFPSRWEGLGGTLIEALALELPIVTSDLGPIREVLGEVPWPRVAVEDHAGLSDALLAVLRGELPVAEIAASGRRRFEALFTVGAAAEGMSQLYARALEESHR